MDRLHFLLPSKRTRCRLTLTLWGGDLRFATEKMDACIIYILIFFRNGGLYMLTCAFKNTNFGMTDGQLKKYRIFVLYVSV